jgi:hypothetical protein
MLVFWNYPKKNYFRAPPFPGRVENVKQEMQTNPNDYIRLKINHPRLDSPVWLVFTQSKNLDEDFFLSKMEGIQQLKKEFLLTELDFFHVKYPEGSGGTKMKNLHLDKDQSESSSRSTTPRILYVYPVLSVLSVFMPKSLIIQTYIGRING